jgi:chromosome segregation ATPase
MAEPWNKGRKTGPRSEATKQRIAEAQRKRRQGESRAERELRNEIDKLRAQRAEIDERLPRLEDALRTLQG